MPSDEYNSLRLHEDEWKRLLRKRLDDRRSYHSVCVAEESRYLAKIYHGNREKAYIAGLLHDITKQENKEEQRRRIESSGIVLNAVELQSPQLWHAISGMLYVRDELGIDDTDILNAIRYHTTARADMSLLEKIVFLADCTSKDRKFKGIAILRNIAYHDIDQAILFQLKSTIGTLVKNKKVLHVDTVDAYNQYCMNSTEER